MIFAFVSRRTDGIDPTFGFLVLVLAHYPDAPIRCILGLQTAILGLTARF